MQHENKIGGDCTGRSATGDGRDAAMVDMSVNPITDLSDTTKKTRTDQADASQAAREREAPLHAVCLLLGENCGMNLICYCIVPFIVMACIAGGAAWGVVGQKSMGEASKLDPAREFKALGKACTISKIARTAEMQSLCVQWQPRKKDDLNQETCERNAKLCVDTYEYFFVESATIGTNDLTTYRGNTRSTERRYRPPGSSWFSGSMENKPCEESLPENNPRESLSFPDTRSWLAVEDEILCWKPAVPVAELPKSKTKKDIGYMCYDTACWKMDDPVDEARTHAQKASFKFYGGWILAGTGGFILLVWLYCGPVRKRFQPSAADVPPDAPQSVV